MSDTELKVSIVASAEGLTAGLQKAKSEIQGFGNVVAGVAKGIVGAFAGVALGQIIHEQLKKAVEAAIDAQSAFVHLKDSVEIAGQSWEKYSAQVMEAVASLRETTRFSKGELREGLTSLIQLTGDAALAMKALPAVADLAAARHMEFARAADMVAKGAEGMAVQLRRAGIAFSEGEKAAMPFGTEAQRLDVIIAKLNQKFGGAAQADLDSYAAGIKRIGNEMQEARAKFGEGLIGMGLDAYQFLNDVGVKTGFGGPGMTFAERIAAEGQNRTIAALRQLQGRAPTPEQARALAAMQGDLASGTLINAKDIEDARKKAIEDARKAADAIAAEAARIAKVYDDLFQRLSAGTTDAGTKFKALTDILGDTSDGWLKFGTNLTGIEHLLKELGITAIDTGKAIISFGGTLDLRSKTTPAFGAPGTIGGSTAIDVANAAVFEKRQEQELQTEHEKLIIAATGQLARLEQERVAMLKLADEFARRVANPLSSAFADFATTGGKNVGQIMAQAFAEEIASGSKDLFNGILNSLGGGGVTFDPKTNTYTFPGATQGYQSKDQAVSAQLLKNSPNTAAGIAVGTAAFGAFQTGNTTGASDLANGVSAVASAAAVLATMATIYGSLAAAGPVGWIAAAVVAVAQVVGKLLQPSPGSTYQYAAGVGVNKEGVFGGRPNANIDKNTWAQMVAAGQATFESFYNSYYRLMMKFSTELLPDVSKAFGAIYGRFESGADLGMAASEKFGQEFAAFLASGLPKEIGARFNQYLKADFATLGVTAESWNATWAKLLLLDPKAQIQALNDWVDALTIVQEAIANLKRPTGFGPQTFDSAFGFGGTVIGQMAGEGAKSYGDKLADLDKKILDFGKGLGHLVGPELLASERQLAQMVADRYAQEKQYIQAIIDALVSGARAAQDAIDSWKLAEMGLPGGGGPQAQIDYLKNKADLYAQLSLSTTDPAIAKKAHDDWMNTINQIVQIGAGQGPDAAKAFYDWAIAATKSYQTEWETHLASLGSGMDAENAKFLAQFQPIYERFLQGLAGGGDAATALSTNLDNASAALIDFADAVHAASAALAGVGAGAGSGDGSFVSNVISGR